MLTLRTEDHTKNVKEIKTSSSKISEHIYEKCVLKLNGIKPTLFGWNQRHQSKNVAADFIAMDNQCVSEVKRSV